VTTAEDVPAILRRAFKVASTPPTGPVFVSLTWDAMTEEADVDLVPATYGYFRVRPDPDAVREATRLLSAARRPLIVVGDRVSQSEGAPRLVAAVAEQLGAPVYATSFSEVHIPSSHPHFLGVFNTSWFHRTMKQRFDAADAILAVGTEMMTQSIPTPEPPIAGPVRLIHLDSSDWAIQRSYPVTVGLLGDIAVALGELSAALGAAMSASQKEAARRRGAAVAAERRARQEAFEAVAREHWDDQPMSPERLAVELRESLPADALVCDDAITVSNTLLEAIPFDAPGALIGSRGGSVGVGMGAALGMKLAAPDRPVVAVIGDGTAMYAIQALWTAASYRIPVTYVMCNNRSYKVLRENMTRYLTGSPRRSEYVGMDFYRLPLDFVKLAAAFEVPGIRVERPEELAPAVRRGLTSRGPLVIDAILDDSFDGAEIQKRWAEWWNA
jgi:benzoylformate decarboxylase